MTYRTMQALGLAVTLLQRAMEKCDRRTDIPRRHRAGSQLDHQRAALLITGQTRTSSLGAARPLPPSADIGPRGQSVRAAQFCFRNVPLPRPHVGLGTIDWLTQIRQLVGIFAPRSNASHIVSEGCAVKTSDLTPGPLWVSEKATLSGGCGSTGQSCNMRQCPCQFLFVTKKTFQQYLATGRPQHAFTCGNHFSGSRIVGLMPQDLAGPERRSLAGSAALERNFPLRAEIA